jgi:hypothetical protein
MPRPICQTTSLALAVADLPAPMIDGIRAAEPGWLRHGSG